MRFLEKIKICLDVGVRVGAIMMDLLKACNYPRHDHLTAKLYAYGFSYDAPFLIHSYLHQRQHVSNLFLKVSSKLHALPCIAHYIDQNKVRMASFTKRKFQYCHLAWKFHSGIEGSKQGRRKHGGSRG